MYLAFAAALASGLDGIRNKIEPPPSLEGNIYFAKDLLTVPRSLVNLLCMNFEASYTYKFVLSTFENCLWWNLKMGGVV